MLKTIKYAFAICAVGALFLTTFEFIKNATSSKSKNTASNVTLSQCGKFGSEKIRVGKEYLVFPVTYKEDNPWDEVSFIPSPNCESEIDTLAIFYEKNTGAALNHNYPDIISPEAIRAYYKYISLEKTALNGLLGNVLRFEHSNAEPLNGMEHIVKKVPGMNKSEYWIHYFVAQKDGLVNTIIECRSDKNHQPTICTIKFLDGKLLTEIQTYYKHLNEMNELKNQSLTKLKELAIK